MNTFDIGPVFIAPARFVTNLERLPLFGTLPSQETEPPYRHATAFFARIPFTPFGAFLGVWKKTGYSADTALMHAIAGAGFDLDEEIDDADKRTVRELVADYAEGDLDTEWEIVNYLGLD